MDELEYDAIKNDIEYANRDEWERMRLQTFFLKQNNYLKKNCKLKDFMPFSWEKFKGSTKADPKMVEWFKSLKKRDK